MLRKIARDAGVALVMGAVVSFLVYTTAGDLLSESPADALARLSRQRVAAQHVEALEGTVISALGEMEIDADHLVKWYLDHPDSRINRLWAMQPAEQKNAAVIALYIRSQNGGVKPLTAWREAVAFVHYSKKYDVPITLTVAVANAESHFEPKARSGYGAMGIMQVVWRIHTNLLRANGIKTANELYDPEKGIAAGTLLLSRYLRAYETPQKALSRYYGGPVAKYWAKVSRNINRVKSWGLSEL